ncbi:MAG TPA: DUF4424 family protein [Candidatus Solibacter sp.]|nr:DUF4424 family protein [Candidatus Solibacter sp.]
MLSKRLAILLAVAFLGASARADDTRSSLPAGGLVPTGPTSIQIESEEVEITPRRISIHYVLRNPGDQDESPTVAFRLPDMDGMALCADTYRLPHRNEVNYMGFNVNSGGNPIPKQISVTAFHEGQDVTSRLAAAGITPNVLLQPLNAALAKIPPDQLQRLEDDGLIESHQFENALIATGKRRGWCGQWTMRVEFTWTQPIAAHQAVDLTQVYGPVAGGTTVAPTSDPSSYSGNYCAGSANMDTIVKARAAAAEAKDKDDKTVPIVFYEQAIDFLLTSMKGWNGPIGTFHLSVVPLDPHDLVMTCTIGLERTAYGKYEMSRENYASGRDLHLMILQRNRPLGW